MTEGVASLAGDAGLGRRLGRAARAAARATELVASTAGLAGIYEAHARLSGLSGSRAGEAGPTRADGVPSPSGSARREALLDRYRRLWAAGMLHTGATATVLAAPVPAPAHGPRLVVANHRSMLDIPVLLRLFGGNFLGLAELAEWPMLGQAARMAGVVFVDRTDQASRVSALRAVRRLLDTGATVIVFPEGTTFPGDEVRPFNPGAFLVGADVELVPVGLAYDDPTVEYGDEGFVEHASRIGRRRRTRVSVAVGSPIDAARRPRSARALAELARDQVQSLVRAARPHINP